MKKWPTESVVKGKCIISQPCTVKNPMYCICNSCNSLYIMHRSSLNYTFSLSLTFFRIPFLSVLVQFSGHFLIFPPSFSLLHSVRLYFYLISFLRWRSLVFCFSPLCSVLFSVVFCSRLFVWRSVSHLTITFASLSQFLSLSFPTIVPDRPMVYSPFETSHLQLYLSALRREYVSGIPSHQLTSYYNHCSYIDLSKRVTSHQYKSIYF